MSDLAGGPLGLVSEPFPKDESKAGVPDKSGKAQQQAPANESPQVSPEVQKMVESAVESGCTQEKACDVVGVTPRTYQRWRSAPDSGNGRCGPHHPPSKHSGNGMVR